MLTGPAFQEDPRATSSMEADAMEAILGAIYVDSGHNFAKCEAEAASWFEPKIELMLEGSFPVSAQSLDPGSPNHPIQVLQEFAQQRGTDLPEYKTISKKGEDHKCLWEVEVTWGEVRARGSGRTKKDARTMAAERALSVLEDDRLEGL